MSFNPIGYIYALAGQPLPPIGEEHLFEYVLAGNGLFVRSRRNGMEAMLPLVFARVKGLEVLTPYVHLDQKIPKTFLHEMLMLVWEAGENEILFWLNFTDEFWELIVPKQTASPGGVKPLDPFDPAGANALVDAHSHGRLEAFFSPTDNADETGFRLYLVFGESATRITARVGVFGHTWKIPVEWVFEGWSDEAEDIEEVWDD